MCDALLHKVYCSPFCTIFLLSEQLKGHLSLVCFFALSPVYFCFLAVSFRVLSFPSFASVAPSVKPAFCFSLFLFFVQSLRPQTEVSIKARHLGWSSGFLRFLFLGSP
jgi:hypothetical protein